MKAHCSFTAHDGNHLSKGFWNYNKFLWSSFSFENGSEMMEEWILLRKWMRNRNTLPMLIIVSSCVSNFMFHILQFRLTMMRESKSDSRVENPISFCVGDVWNMEIQKLISRFSIFLFLSFFQQYKLANLQKIILNFYFP